jgi:hypothetical protein
MMRAEQMPVKRNLTNNSFAVLVLFAAMNLSAHAASYTFSFNSPGLSENNTASQIATYMTNALVANGCTGCSVAVAGAVVDTTYNGENNVVGPGGASLTLGNSNGATSNSSTTPGSPDNFLATTTDSSSPVSTEISLAFAGVTITNVSFDFEIFPNGTCPSLSSCGSYNSSTGFYANQPDFEFTAGTGIIGSGTAVDAFGSLGNGFVYGVAPSSTNAGAEKAGNNGSSTRSPGNNPELAPQWIGVSGALALSSVTDLNFIDWPATIGIDNLEITYTPSRVPEPSSILLFSTVAGALLFRIRRIRPAR